GLYGLRHDLVEGLEHLVRTQRAPVLISLSALLSPPPLTPLSGRVLSSSCSSEPALARSASSSEEKMAAT
ncbi:MAG: hypothetical protein WBX25_29385, partial [Rhodomicrobium sp.]